MTSLTSQFQGFLTGENTCPIWGTECLEKIQDEDSIIVRASPRAGGDYVIDRSILAELRRMYGWWDVDRSGNESANMFRARLTTILVKQRQLGNYLPRITERTIEAARSASPARMEERLMNLLRFLVDRTPKVGEPLGMGFDPIQQPSFGNSEEAAAEWQNTQYGLAYSECIDFDELDYLANGLAERGLVEKGSQISTSRGNYVMAGFGFLCKVTTNGYIAIEQLQTERRSDQCFVAMWFRPETRDLYHKAIEPGVKAAGYVPLLIENKIDFIGEIDDEVIAEIRRSRFVVADFTHGDDGARGSVYYEAGFARGLDIPVIFTCREDQIDDRHFDTSHFLHLPWPADAPEDLIEPLKNRIIANIGAGPHAAGE